LPLPAHFNLRKIATPGKKNQLLNFYRLLKYFK